MELEPLLRGRHLWMEADMGEGQTPLVVGFKVTGLKQFLPAGPVAYGEPPSRESHRERHLVQLFTDKGMRTIAVADLRSKQPRR